MIASYVWVWLKIKRPGQTAGFGPHFSYQPRGLGVHRAWKTATFLGFIRFFLWAHNFLGDVSGTLKSFPSREVRSMAMSFKSSKILKRGGTGTNPRTWIAARRGSRRPRSFLVFFAGGEALSVGFLYVFFWHGRGLLEEHNPKLGLVQLL